MSETYLYQTGWKQIRFHHGEVCQNFQHDLVSLDLMLVVVLMSVYNSSDSPLDTPSSKQARMLELAESGG